MKEYLGESEKRSEIQEEMLEVSSMKRLCNSILARGLFISGG